MTCVLKMGVLGINHKIANLPFREAVARGAATLCGEKAVFFSHPILVLSTCNRTEVYFGGEDLALIHSELLQWLRGYIHEPFEHRLYSYFGLDCFRHLSCVAAGLDSAVLAETEIQAQVKTAYNAACKVTKLPSCMHYMFQKALKLGKLARSELAIDRAPNLFQAIWSLASLRCYVEKARILFVGYSEINRRMIHFLRQRHVQQMALITRCPAEVLYHARLGCVNLEGHHKGPSLNDPTPAILRQYGPPHDHSNLDPSEALQNSHNLNGRGILEGVSLLGYDAIDTWRDYDLVICASRQDRYLISGKSSRSHVIFDLSVPRNVDPSVEECEEVVLYNIEQINAWIQQKKSQHTEQISDAYARIWQETIRLAQIYRQKTFISKTQYALDI